MVMMNVGDDPVGEEINPFGYSWQYDRQCTKVETEDDVNKLFGEKSEYRCVRIIRWLKNPDGEWWVNRVYLVECNFQDRKENQLLVLKICHPWWNTLGKTVCEARALQNFGKCSFPAPKLHAYFAHPIRSDWNEETRSRGTNERSLVYASSFILPPRSNQAAGTRNDQIRMDIDVLC